LTTIALLSLVYLSGIIAANVVTSHYGLVPAGFGLLVPAGTYAAGLVLIVRNAVQETGGRTVVILCIIAGAALSAVFGSGRIALASGATFLVSETLDTVAYTTLRRRGWRRAAIAGTTIGAVLDTIMFLSLSGLGLSLHAVTGQVLVKGCFALLVYLLTGELISRILPARTVSD
jgi:hypothetical protein